MNLFGEVPPYPPDRITPKVSRPGSPTPILSPVPPGAQSLVTSMPTQLPSFPAEPALPAVPPPINKPIDKKVLLAIAAVVGILIYMKRK